MINLYNQDCMEAMAGFDDNQFDLAIVDPPYGINFADKGGDGSGKLTKHRWKQHKRKKWDKEIPSKKYYEELFRVSKNQIIWGANYMVQNLPPSMGWVFWDKGQRNFSLADGELAFTSFQRALRVFTMTRPEALQEGQRLHPTQKPAKLYEWLLMNYAKKGDKILDTHLGSGSIAIACHNLGYDLQGYELDKDYYIAAKKRLEEHQAQLRMF